MKKMKVIYNTCYADPWLKVAQKLKKEHGWEPVYWNGYRDHDADNSKTLVPEAFPNCIYQEYNDAWKGIFPKEIEEGYSESYLDIDFLREYASYELQAIKMMDRMDPDRYSFNFMERQRHFRKMLKYWTACLNLLKPDIVVSAVVPHRIYDYVLYLLCKYHKIKYVTFRGFNFPGIIIPLNDANTVGDLFDQEYKTFQNSDLDINQLELKLSNEILEGYNKVKEDYKIAEPNYMKQHVLTHKKNSNIFLLLNTLYKQKTDTKVKLFGKKGMLLNGVPTYLKNKNKSLQKSNISLVKYVYLKLKGNFYKKTLNSYYSKKTTDIVKGLPYILLPLHYQPEMTSNPSGDIFVDQLLCVEMLLKNSPSDFLIYVKEHRSQFYAHTEGHTSRMKEFYDDLLKYPRVRLISESYDQFELIKHSKAVATITGTAGWEAMILGKPVICFGLSWYEKYQGVLRITDEKSASKIEEFIINFNFNERDLLCYLNAFRKKSVNAYFYPGLKEQMNQPEEECVNNLVQSVLSMSKLEI